MIWCDMMTDASPAGTAAATCRLVPVYFRHQRQPPSKMRADALVYTPFCEHFELAVLPLSFANKRNALRVEAELIEKHGTHMPSKGYNFLLGDPQAHPRFWAMHKAQGRL
jgi:hypothetical protein